MFDTFVQQLLFDASVKIMYTVVEWLDSNPIEVSVVPTKWLSKDKDGSWLCCWPSSVHSGDKAIRNCSDAHRDWKKYRVNSITTAGMNALYFCGIIRIFNRRSYLYLCRAMLE